MGEWVGGRRTVSEVLKSNLAVKRVLIESGGEGLELEEIRRAARARGVPVKTVERRSLGAFAPGNVQSVAAEIEPAAPAAFKEFLAALEISPRTFLCLLDEIQDPQNLGAIVRNAVCFGCSGLILPKWRSAGLTPAVMKASSGALAHCPVAEISNLGVAVERLKERGFFIYGADAGEGAQALEGFELQYPLALILGSEHQGIKPTLKKACDGLLRITQDSRIQSLNVASASAVFFHEIYRHSLQKQI